MPSPEPAHLTEALRRSWFGTALTAAAAGAVLLFTAHGPITAYLDTAGGLALLTAAVATTTGFRACSRVARAPVGSGPRRWDVPLVAVLATLAIIAAAAGLVITSF